MTTADDLPWPELGNVSRGATRGNQGQKGVLGAPDRDGRATLQLRVQPGVLAVKLNRQATEWYRILDTEVNRALKLTKTYWRKARRRQDYDARADQDHMELHEWLQQLKDKTMSHLELLMQKGDIQGPPYVMSDEIEITFLRKFIERQANGIPHNPRLRNAPGDSTYPPRDYSTAESLTSEASDTGFMDPSQRVFHDRLSDGSSPHLATTSRLSISPSLRNTEALSQEPKQGLQAARNALARAQKDTQDAFMRYTACLDVERQARQVVAAAEKRRDEFLGVPPSQHQTDFSIHSLCPDSKQNTLGLDMRPRRTSFTNEDRRSPVRYPTDDIRTSADPFNSARLNTKPLDWNTDVQSVYPSDPTTHYEDQSIRSRKRSWEPNPHDGQYSCDDMTALPPRKRLHHMIPGFDVMNNTALHAQNIGLQT